MLGKRMFITTWIGLFILPLIVSTVSAQGGLVAYYPLDGDERDYSNNENHGLQSGGIEYLPGVMGNTARFDGIRNAIHVRHSEELNLKDEFTISLYANPNVTNGVYEGNFYDTANGAPTLVSKDGKGDPTGPYNLYLRATNSSKGSMGQEVWFEIQNNIDTLGLGNQTLDLPILTPDTFHHIVWRHYDDVYEIWVDGSLEMSVNSTFEPESGTRNLLIGRRGWNNGYFKGMIDEVKMYDYAISLERIKVQADLLGLKDQADPGTYADLLRDELAHIEANKKTMEVEVEPEEEEEEPPVTSSPPTPRTREPKGICGPSSILILGVAPMILRRKRARK